MYLEVGVRSLSSPLISPSMCTPPPPPHPPSRCFEQMSKLKEEKERSVSQAQELETSLAELRNQIGELGLRDLGMKAGVGAGESSQGCRWVGGRALWPRERGPYQELARLAISVSQTVKRRRVKCAHCGLKHKEL